MGSEGQVGPEGQPSGPIHDRQWSGPEGTRWHMRGDELSPRAARRLLQRPGRLNIHAYGPEAQLVSGDDLAAVLTRPDEFFAGQADPHVDFRVADFRNGAHQVMLVVEESC